MESTSHNKSLHYIHSSYIKINKENDAVIVKLKEIDSITKESKNILKIHRNPERMFWLTKPNLRNHTYKKEYETLDNLDAYKVKNINLRDAIYKKLNNNSFGNCIMSLKELCNNVYVYGADTDIEMLIKKAYKDREIYGVVPKYTLGSLDTEVSVLTSNYEIIIVTYIHENIVYTGVLDRFLYKYVGDKRIKASLEDIQKIINEHITRYIDKYQFKINIQIFSSEMEMLHWIFINMHKNETDFVGIWNANYDVPKIVERLKLFNIEPRKWFSHPDIPDELKGFKCIFEAAMDGEHFTDAWFYTHASSHTTFIDNMLLYSRLRKVNGRDSSYTLDAISTKEIGEGKLKFGEQSTHYQMQKYKFCEYVVYNIVDAMLLRMMEIKNNDITTMTNLIGSSLIKDFNKQTVMLKNRFYWYCKERNLIPASPGKDMITEFDSFINKVGGTVLPPERTQNIGLNILKEIDIETLFYFFVSDLDVSSMYPNVTAGFNISKETKLATGLFIDGRADLIERYFGSISSPTENAISIMKEFYNCPDYEEIHKLYLQHIRSKALNKNETTNI
jgi:hypothetical protein